MPYSLAGRGGPWSRDGVRLNSSGLCRVRVRIEFVPTPNPVCVGLCRRGLPLCTFPPAHPSALNLRPCLCRPGLRLFTFAWLPYPCRQGLTMLANPHHSRAIPEVA